MSLVARSISEGVPLYLPEGHVNFVRIQTEFEISLILEPVERFINHLQIGQFRYDFNRWVDPFGGTDYGIITRHEHFLVVHHGLVANLEIEEIIRRLSRDKTMALLPNRVPRHHEVVAGLEKFKEQSLLYSLGSGLIV